MLILWDKLWLIKYKNGRKALDTFNKKLGLILLAIGVIGLSACSSKPSPWTQQSSPWANREGEAPAAEAQPLPDEQSPFADQATKDDSTATAEPMMGGDMMGEPAEPLPMEPAEPMEPAPMAGMAEEPMMGSGQPGDIRSQPPGYYTVQLVASSNMKNLMAFTRRNNLSDQWVAETNVNGKTWYVLLSGVYATRDEAQAALADARAKLTTSPWIRSVGSVQAVMAP